MILALHMPMLFCIDLVPILSMNKKEYLKIYCFTCKFFRFDIIEWILGVYLRVYDMYFQVVIFISFLRQEQSEIACLGRMLLHNHFFQLTTTFIFSLLYFLCISMERGPGGGGVFLPCKFLCCFFF